MTQTTPPTDALDFLTNEAEAAEVEAERPPRMYWHNGAKSKAGDTPGDFYISADELLDEPGAPWVPSKRFDDEPGYAAELLHIAPILVRQQPYSVIKGVNGAKDTWVWGAGRWQPGQRIYTEILCFVDGIAEPVNLIVKGLTGKAFSAKGGVLSTALAFRREAERVAKKPLPPWAFWLPVATKKDAKGKIAFEDTGYGSVVTPPVLYLPDGTTQERMQIMFIGKERYNEGFVIAEQFAAWAAERRTNEDAPAEEQASEAAPPARNQPQAIEVSDDGEILPF